MKKVLFIDEVHPSLEESLTAMGFNCEQDYSSTYEEILLKLDRYVGMVIRSRIPIDANLLNSAKNLRFIARSGAGLENIDTETARENGIEVFNSPEGNRDAVGEHAIGMLLSLFNHLTRCDNQVRKGIWDRENNRGIELAGKTVGIIGFGNMGSALAKKLQGFDCRILAYDKYKQGYASSGVEEVSLKIIMEKSDVISLHLPQSQETIHFIDREFIDSCSKPFFLINTARGRHVNTKDLLYGIESGKILGAALDVLEFEKKSFERLVFDEMPETFKKLVSREEVMLSPHVAGWTRESYLKLSTFLASKIEGFAKRTNLLD